MAKKYKALMVVETTHKKVVVDAKKKGLTVDEFIRQLLTKKQ